MTSNGSCEHARRLLDLGKPVLPTTTVFFNRAELLQQLMTIYCEGAGTRGPGKRPCTVCSTSLPLAQSLRPLQEVSYCRNRVVRLHSEAEVTETASTSCRVQALGQVERLQAQPGSCLQSIGERYCSKRPWATTSTSSTYERHKGFSRLTSEGGSRLSTTRDARREFESRL